ncbi:MAG: DUF4129 domain-containing protein [Anaerolineae bacterium]|nr:DUF4129 domain-containing protein [Anaerolineae bacterium]
MTAETMTGRQSHSLLVAFWAYVRHELLYVAWALLEVSLLAPLALSIISWARFWSPAAFALWLLLILLVPFNLNRLLTLYEVPASRQRKIVFAALLLTVILSLRALLYEDTGIFGLQWLRELYRHFVEPGNPLWSRDLSLFFLLLFLWWRGLSLAGRSPDIKDMGLRLRFSSLILAPLIAGIATLTGTPVLGFVLLHFFVTLVAVSLTRAEEIALERTGRSYPLRPRWLAVIALTSLALVSAAGLLAMAISGEGLEQLVTWTAPVWVAIRFFTTTLVSVVSHLVFYLLLPLFWIGSRLMAWLRSLEVLPLAPPSDQPPPEAIDLNLFLRQLTGPEEPILLWVNRLLLLLFFALLLFATVAAVSHLVGNRRLSLQSEERSVAPERRSRGPGLGQRLRRRLTFWQQWRAAASIRRIYRQMGELAAAYGYPRAAAQTPNEYLSTLGELWPDGQDESTQITQAYVRVRYGEVPETEEELQALRRAWAHLRRLPPPEEEQRNP